MRNDLIWRKSHPECLWEWFYVLVVGLYICCCLQRIIFSCAISEAVLCRGQTAELHFFYSLNSLFILSRCLPFIFIFYVWLKSCSFFGLNSFKFSLGGFRRRLNAAYAVLFFLTCEFIYLFCWHTLLWDTELGEKTQHMSPHLTDAWRQIHCRAGRDVDFS